MSKNPLCQLRDDSGAVLVEFVVGIAVLSVVMFGLFDCARALYIHHFVEAASQSAARFAMVRGSTWNGTACSSNANKCMATSHDVDSYVRADLPPGVAPSKLTVSTVWPGTVPSGASCSNYYGNNSPGCTVTVSVSYSFSFLFAFLPRSVLTLASSSSLLITS